jgi:hypothetical protein
VTLSDQLHLGREWAIFLLNFKGKPSQEEHETIFSPLNDLYSMTLTGKDYLKTCFLALLDDITKPQGLCGTV